jgi:PIN domain nuclease of toxin-antitoxin system
MQADSLPDIHRDPVDRMLIAHAIAAGLVLVTADRQIDRYPVRTLW